MRPRIGIDSSFGGNVAVVFIGVVIKSDCHQNQYYSKRCVYLSLACFGKDMGFAIEKLFILHPILFVSFLQKQSWCKSYYSPFFIGSYHCFWAVQVYDQIGEHVFWGLPTPFEPIEATHSAVSALLNADTGELAVLALVRGFRFPLALMEEHFNENISRVINTPKRFKGSITDFDQPPPTNRKLSTHWELSMHGVTKPSLCQLPSPNQMNKSLWRLPFRSKHQTLALNPEFGESKSMKTYKLRCLYLTTQNKPLWSPLILKTALLPLLCWLGYWPLTCWSMAMMPYRAPTSLSSFSAVRWLHGGLCQ